MFTKVQFTDGYMIKNLLARKWGDQLDSQRNKSRISWPEKLFEKVLDMVDSNHVPWRL